MGIYIIYNYKQGRYNNKYIDGLFIINFIEDITHRAGCPCRPPAPGSLLSGCCRPPDCHVPRAMPYITLIYAVLPRFTAILHPCNAVKAP